MLALVAPCSVIGTRRAGTQYIAVGQKAFTGWAVELFYSMLGNIAVFIEVIKDTLSYFGLLRCRSSSKIVEGNIKPIVYFSMNCMIE